MSLSTSTLSPSNPFRNPRTSSSASVANASSTTPSRVVSSPIRQPQETGQSTAPSSQPQDSSPSAAEIREALEAEPDELPPPYTPGPAAVTGETTLEFGPLRPFQPPPPQSNPSRLLSPQSTGWSQYPGSSRPPPTLSSGSGSVYLPPPSHPMRRSTGSFRDDFYSAGTDTRAVSEDGHDIPAPPGGYPRPRYNPPPGHAPPRHAPPPGQPPAASSSSSTTTGEQNDGRPTTTPTPGHPLLRNGNVLVYPRGHTCYKCDNTGFKSNDPSHPCRKCWERYAKPFQGPITYAPWSSSASNLVTGERTNLQRPLRAFRPPTSSFLSQGPLMPVSRDNWGTIGGGVGRSVSTSGIPTRMASGRPPPGALIVQPGDPRIGGRLCWRCDGSGEVSFLIFDSDTCPVCNGSGRTF